MKLASFRYFSLWIAVCSRAVQCCYSGSPSTLSVGDDTHVCITVSSAGTWDDAGTKTYSRVAFKPTVDDFTMLEIKESWTNSSTDDDTLAKALINNGTVPTSLYVVVESEGEYSSDQKMFRGSGVTFPASVAIIHLVEGKVDQITWDNGCFFCSDSDCKSNTYKYDGSKRSTVDGDCYVQDDDCTESKCHVKVYVVWTGTDKDGNYLMSQQKKLSNFQSYDVDLSY